jgi:lysozyme
MTDINHDIILKVTPLLKAHEGLRLKPYTCTAGKLTIGYGRNLDDMGINKAEAEHLLAQDINRAIHDARSLIKGFDSLSLTRKAVLVDMMFNLGMNRLSQFKNMLYAIEEHNYSKASFEMLNSLWAVQVGARASVLAEMMAHGA